MDSRAYRTSTRVLLSRAGLRDTLKKNGLSLAAVGHARVWTTVVSAARQRLLYAGDNNGLGRVCEGSMLRYSSPFEPRQVLVGFRSSMGLIANRSPFSSISLALAGKDRSHYSIAHRHLKCIAPWAVIKSFLVMYMVASISTAAAINLRHTQSFLGSDSIGIVALKICIEQLQPRCVSWSSLE